jgi:hypothetical protein
MLSFVAVVVVVVVVVVVDVEISHPTYFREPQGSNVPNKNPYFTKLIIFIRLILLLSPLTL